MTNDARCSRCHRKTWGDRTICKRHALAQRRHQRAYHERQRAAQAAAASRKRQQPRRAASASGESASQIHTCGYCRVPGHSRTTCHKLEHHELFYVLTLEKIRGHWLEARTVLSSRVRSSLR